MGLYEVPLSMSLVGVLCWCYEQFSTCSKRLMCFGCLMFILSGPCELLFLLCFIASWTRVVVSVMLYPSIFIFLINHKYEPVI